MATIKKVKKYQNAPKPVKKKSNTDFESYYSPTARAVDSLRAVGSGQLGTPEGEKTLKRLKMMEAKEAKEDAMFMKKKGMKKGKTGVSVKKKMQAGGVAGKQTKAGMVDPKGAYTKVQMRTLGSMKKGGKMSKKK